MFSERVKNTPSSFIRNILKVLVDPEIISFAGGLPNPVSFPIADMQLSMRQAYEKYGDKLFQYSSTEGLVQLKELIGQRYKQRFGLTIKPEEILITNGSQQAVDLLSKSLLNDGDSVITEKPGYLGALQVLTFYRANVHAISLEDDGLDVNQLEDVLKKNDVKLMYTVPTFQNPTGLTYSLEKRKAVREVLSKYPDVVLIEDDPYGELRISGDNLPYIGMDYLPNSVLLGSFSKTIMPGMRVGYVITKNPDLMNYLVMVKQATDLHSNIFTQYALYEYLTTFSYQDHINKITGLYRELIGTMLSAMDEYFPENVTYTRPEGGMFLWATLPNGQSSYELFNKAMTKKVAFVPGNPFYVGNPEVSSFRLNFTKSTPDVLREGIRRLGSLLKQ